MSWIRTVNSLPFEKCVYLAEHIHQSCSVIDTSDILDPFLHGAQTYLAVRPSDDEWNAACTAFRGLRIVNETQPQTERVPDNDVETPRTLVGMKCPHTTPGVPRATKEPPRAEPAKKKKKPTDTPRFSSSMVTSHDQTFLCVQPQHQLERTAEPSEPI